MDADSLDTPRTAEEIARRVIALQCVIAAAHGVSKEDVTDWLKEEELWGEATPRELAFFAGKRNAKKEVIWMTWMVEAQVALMWSIRKLDLPPPTGKCDTGAVIAAIPGLFDSTSPFVKSAKLRSRKAILKAEEEIYDIHCQVNQAKRNGKEAELPYDSDVVFFRHYGLCWVRGYCGQAWDVVSPDT